MRYDYDLAAPQLMHISDNPTCPPTLTPFGRRSLGVLTPDFPANPDISDSKTIGSTANTSIMARGSPIDNDTLIRLIRTIYPLLMAIFVHTINPKFLSLTPKQLAEAQAFAHVSATTWGNASLVTWAWRLHEAQQRYGILDPLDPRADVLNMICEGPESNTETLGILTLLSSVCMTQSSDCTNPSNCLLNSTSRSFEAEGGGSLRRQISEVSTAHLLSELKPPLTTRYR